MLNQFQLITLIVSILPLGNILFLKFFKNFSPITILASKIFPIASLIITSLLLINNISREVVLYTPLDKLEMSFLLNKNSLIFLLILNIFWSLFIFYLQKFISLSSTNNAVYFFENFLTIIASLTLLAASNDLFSIFIFFQILVIIFYQYSNRFLHKKDSTSPSYFSAIIYLESLVLLIGVVLAYQNFDSLKIDFISKNISQLSSNNLVMFLTLMISPTLIFSITPFYLFYRKINLNPLIIFVLFFFSYFLSHSYLFVKFYFEIFKSIHISRLVLTIFEVIFLFSTFAASIFLVFSKNLKSSFFYLFFQQLLVAIYSTILLLFFKYSSPILPLISFGISFFVIVCCLSNILLFFENSKKKKQERVLKDLKTSTILLVIAIANIASLLPAIGMKVSFLVISKIIKEKLVISAIIYAINIFAVIIFFVKIIFPLLLKDGEHEKFIQDEELANQIDKNYSLMAPPIIFATSLFLIPIIL